MPSVLSTALGLRPRAIHKTSGTVIPDTDLPAGKYYKHIFITSSPKYIFQVKNPVMLNIFSLEKTAKSNGSRGGGSLAKLVLSTTPYCFQEETVFQSLGKKYVDMDLLGEI